MRTPVWLVRVALASVGLALLVATPVVHARVPASDGRDPGDIPADVRGLLPDSDWVKLFCAETARPAVTEAGVCTADRCVRSATGSVGIA